MLPLAALSFYTIYVIILKVINFAFLSAFEEASLQKALGLLKEKKYTEVEKLLAGKRGPIHRFILSTAKLAASKENASTKEIELEIERVGTMEIRKYETHMKSLEMVAAISPLIGLLGTVIGMVRAFAEIAESGARVDPSQLAGGIWEALITTIGGLVVAIPAFAAYYLIDGYIDRIRSFMKDYAARTVAVFQ